MDQEQKRRIKAVVQYDGTDFAGFQRQAEERTVQATLEEALGELLGHLVVVKGAGRTDAGVHARGQVIAFLTGNPIPASKIPEAVARFLSPDVVITWADEAPLRFDPQRDAVSKTYCYRIWHARVPDVMIGRYAYWYSGALDLGLMEKEAENLLGRHDFVSLRATGSSAKTTVREVLEASWKRRQVEARGELLEFRIAADGFLYKMVRLTVGTLLDIGRGHLPQGTVARLLEAPGSARTGQCVPGKGLCLEKVSFS